MEQLGQQSATRAPIALTLVSIMGILVVGATVTAGTASGVLVLAPAFVGVGVLAFAIVLGAVLAATTARSATPEVHGSVALGLVAALLGAGFLFGVTSPLLAVGIPLAGALTIRRLGRGWGLAVLGCGVLGCAGLCALALGGALPAAPARVGFVLDPIDAGLTAGAVLFGAVLALGFVQQETHEDVDEEPRKARTGTLSEDDMIRMTRSDRFSSDEVAAARATLTHADPAIPPAPDIEATLELQKLESLGVLAGGVAHDFNNLLMSILGNSSIALMETNEEAVLTPVREIEVAAKRARDLVGQLLAYAGKGTVSTTPIDLNTLVREMGDLLATAGSRRVTLDYDFCDAVPLLVADPTQVRQIVMNLITNGADAMSGEPDARIEVRTEIRNLGRTDLDDTLLGVWCEEGPYAGLIVRDHGTGMDEETLARIFDPFYTTKKTGRGLGLAAVLGIVRRYEGTMAVESERGVGTTFRIWFPYAEAVDEDEDFPTEHTSTAKGWVSDAPGEILVVDDDPVVMKVTCRMVQRLDFDVLEAADGEEAVEVYREHRNTITVVVLDMTMPGMDGTETLQALREIDPDVPVILTSGYSEADIPKTEAVFLQKPYTMKQLTKALDQVLE